MPGACGVELPAVPAAVALPQLKYTNLGHIANRDLNGITAWLGPQRVRHALRGINSTHRGADQVGAPGLQRILTDRLAGLQPALTPAVLIAEKA
jgi:hypothetical protein